MSTPSQENKTGMPTTDRRRQVIEHLRDDAFQRADPWAANLATITANLSEIEAALSGRVLKMLQDPNPARGGRFDRQLGIYMKCVREIGRFTQLDVQIRQGNRGID